MEHALVLSTREAHARATTYVRGVIVAGALALLAFALLVPSAPVRGIHLATAGAVAGAVLALQWWNFDFAWRGHRVAVSLDELVVFVALVLLPPAYLAPAILAPVALAQPIRRRDAQKGLFNIAAHTIGLTVAAGAFVLLSARAGAPPLVAAMFALPAYPLATNGLVGGVFARIEGIPTTRVFAQRLARPIVLQVLVGTAGGVALLALLGLHPLAVLAAVPFGLLAQEHVRLTSAAEREAEARRRVAELGRALSPDAEARVAPAVLRVALDLLQAHEAVLELGPDRLWTLRADAQPPRQPLRAVEAPLEASDGAALGRLRVWARRLEPDDDRLVRIIAAEASVILDNARRLDAEHAARGEAEAALRAQRASESRLRAFLDNAPAVIFVKDAEGRYLLGNTRFGELHGRPVPELIGMRDADVMPPEVVARMREADARVLATGEAIEQDESLDVDSRRTFRTIRFPLPDADGAPRLVCGIAIDVTDAKRAEEELDALRREIAGREKLAALGSLVSGVAHEIRTPLTYVANNLYLLRRSANGDEVARDALDAAEEGIERIRQLVGDLRFFAQARPTTRVLAPLDAVVGEAVDLFARTHRARARVALDLAPTPPLSIDRLQVQQVVLNLLANAAEAMPSGGGIRVATRALPDGGAELTVEDEGPGLSEDVRAHMFEPFFTTKSDGTGLGLSIVRRIVAAHDGAIDAATRPEGGARFVVRLPAAAPAPPSAAATGASM